MNFVVGYGAAVGLRFVTPSRQRRVSLGKKIYY